MSKQQMMSVRVPVGFSVEFVRDPVEDVVRVYLRERFEPCDPESHPRVGEEADCRPVPSRDLAVEELAADVGHVDA